MSKFTRPEEQVLGYLLQPLCCYVMMLGLFAVGATPGFAQQPSEEFKSLRNEIEHLRTSQRQIQKDLQLIKSMLLGKQVTPEAPPLENVEISLAGSASMGAPDAKVVVVEFSDYQCPFCGRYAGDTFGRLIRDYVSTGKIQYVLRNFPLREAHPFAAKAAEAAECAGEQGKYWEAHEWLFRHQQTVDAQPLTREAASLGLDAAKFGACLKNGKAAERVRTDEADALRIGVNAAPTFFVGYRDEKDATQMRALKKLTGAQPLDAFAQILEYLLDPPPSDGGNR